MDRLKFNSPAKINLFLRILGKREDGYHELASLFQAVDLMDTLQIALSTQDALTCTDPTLPTDQSNLVLKAADLFRRKTGLTCGIKVHLEKKIPHEAGLGGGSSNAATTLWAMNQLTGVQASTAQLVEWAAEIGSDVPFFLSQGTSYCTGRGEKLLAKPPIALAPLWIVKPLFGTSTPAVYGKVSLANLTPRDPLVALESFYSLKHHYFNDLEAPAFEVMPELAEVKSLLLSAGFTTVLLSGSGSSFFCIGDATPPTIPGCRFYPVKTVHRLLNDWY